MSRKKKEAPRYQSWESVPHAAPAAVGELGRCPRCQVAMTDRNSWQGPVTGIWLCRACYPLPLDLREPPTEEVERVHPVSDPV